MLLISEGRKQKDPKEVSLTQENQSKQKRLERAGGFLGVKRAPAFLREKQRTQIGIKWIEKRKKKIRKEEVRETQ